MLIIRPRDRSDERNEAIVRLYKEGWTQEALAKMWRVTHSQIGWIIGADKRTKKVLPGNISTKLTPKHEQIIRRAPEHLQDLIAEVVLTRRTIMVALGNPIMQ